MSDRPLETAEYDARWGGESHYGGEFAGYTPHLLRFMTRFASPAFGQRQALDVGCGDGYFSEHLAKLGYDVTGIDLSPVGIERAARRVPQGRFQVHDLAAQPLPLADATVDVVWCSEVLEHLFAPLAALAEFHRVLRPGGRALLTVPYHGLLKNLGIALLAFERHYDPTYPHIRFFTKKSLSALVRRAAFDIVTVTHCGSNLGMRDWVVPTNILVAAVKAPAVSATIS